METICILNADEITALFSEVGFRLVIGKNDGIIIKADIPQPAKTEQKKIELEQFEIPPIKLRAKHRRKSYDGPPLQCPTCPRKLGNPQALGKHRAYCTGQPKQKEKSAEGFFYCGQKGCLETFDNREDRERHWNVDHRKVA